MPGNDKTTKTIKRGRKPTGETDQDRELYEQYFSLGKERSINALSIQTGHSRTMLTRTARKFKWQQKCIRRDNQIAKRLEKKTEDKIVDMRAVAIKKTDFYLKIVNEVLEGIFITNPKTGKKEIKIKVQKAGDLEKIVNCFEKLTKLKLTLSGDIEENTGGLNIIIQQTINNNHEKNIEEQAEYKLITKENEDTKFN
jgi:hypothetical protein